MTTPKKSIRPKKMGRPEHAPTPALRRKVSIAAGGGMLHEEIAMALGINRDTLRKHYRQELSIEAQKRRMEVLEAVFTTAKKKGTSAAARAYLGNVPEFESPPLPDGEQAQERPAAPAAPPAPAPVAKLGKKEQAQAEAHTAGQGTEWDDLLNRPRTLQ